MEHISIFTHFLMKGRMMHRLRKHEPNYTKSIGYVSKGVYKDNDFVKKGDTLFTIDKKITN
jgi:hypothetical protein